MLTHPRVVCHIEICNKSDILNRNLWSMLIWITLFIRWFPRMWELTTSWILSWIASLKFEIWKLFLSKVKCSKIWFIFNNYISIVSDFYSVFEFWQRHNISLCIVHFVVRDGSVFPVWLLTHSYDILALISCCVPFYTDV